MEMSTSRREVDVVEHCEWLEHMITSPDCLLWIIMPMCGMVRVERDGGLAVMSIYVLPEFHGKHFGRRAILEATEAAFCAWSITAVIANVRIENERAKNAFFDCGYVERVGQDCLPGHTRYVKHREVA